MIVSTPSFNGKSYLSYPPLSNSSMMLRIAVTIFPTVPNGLILFASFSENNFADYVSIALVNGFVEFSFSLGFGSVTISTSEVLELVVWHTIVAERIGQDGTLVVDDGTQYLHIPTNSNNLVHKTTIVKCFDFKAIAHCQSASFDEFLVTSF